MVTDTDRFHRGVEKLIDRFGGNAIICACDVIQSQNRRWKYAIVSTCQKDFRFHKDVNRYLCKPYKGYWITSDYNSAGKKRILESLRFELLNLSI